MYAVNKNYVISYNRSDKHAFWITTVRLEEIKLIENHLTRMPGSNYYFAMLAVGTYFEHRQNTYFDTGTLSLFMLAILFHSKKHPTLTILNF